MRKKVSNEPGIKSLIILENVVKSKQFFYLRWNENRITFAQSFFTMFVCALKKLLQFIHEIFFCLNEDGIFLGKLLLQHFCICHSISKTRWFKLEKKKNCSAKGKKNFFFRNNKNNNRFVLKTIIDALNYYLVLLSLLLGVDPA